MASQSTQLEETNQLWGQVLLEIQNRLESRQTFETWFKPIQPLTLGPQVVELEVPNAFFIDWIHEHHLSTLRDILAGIFGRSPEVRFTSRESAATAPARSEPASEGTAASRARVERPPGELELNARLTFAHFVVGSSNQFTHAACRAVAERPGHAYNPLFIFAGSGLGKTHLLHAVGHETRLQRPHARICYVPAERFTNEMIYSIQHAQTQAFRNKYRNVDVLLIDDIQFLAGKESTQEEFFYTFNSLRDARKQVVVTADKPPKDIPMLEERLTSRFNQGLVADIKQPDLETRLAILRNRCEEEDVKLPEDALLLIADRIRNNIRDLEGSLVRVFALGSLLHQDITMQMVEEVLQHYVNPEPDQLAPERVVTAVSDAFGIKPDALCGKRRTQSVVLPRQVAMYLLRQLTDLSLVEIGSLFGGRDHTTVMYACDRVAGRIGEDSAFSERVNGLISTLASG
ncbi:MAG TPA: chromosomal replication initiator protein DnaA [Gemmatimonadales bacterium]|nr:chromosomal replication initiator protein DnaA [Gemmatimonadales bacterium]